MPETSSSHERTARAPRGVRPPARADRRRRLAFVVVLVACLAFALNVGLNSPASAPAPPVAAASATETRVDPNAAQAGGNFSKFAHTNPNHSRLPCLLCHARENNSPKPSLPGHLPCSGCHTQQFADTNSPICAICHTDTRSGAVKAFPPLRSFNVRFDHARHASGAARPRANCAACHRPARGGVALSIPAGTAAHNTCYQCHTARAQTSAGADISSCSTCHRIGRYARTPERAPAYAINFSHAKHGARQRLDCNDCHNLRSGMPQGRQVTSPRPLMHRASLRAQSCMTCHNDQRAFGGDDFTDCKRCHTGNAWHF